MKKQTKKHYEVPSVEAVEITPATVILQSGDISAMFAIDELGITDTDAGSAIWE